MGTTDEIFQLAGGLPHMMEQLNSFVRDGAIAVAVDLSIRAEIPSGPLALDTSKRLSISKTSSSVHKMLLGHSKSLGVGKVETGGYDELKTAGEKVVESVGLILVRAASSAIMCQSTNCGVLFVQGFDGFPKTLGVTGI